MKNFLSSRSPSFSVSICQSFLIRCVNLIIIFLRTVYRLSIFCWTSKVFFSIWFNLIIMEMILRKTYEIVFGFLSQWRQRYLRICFQSLAEIVTREISDALQFGSLSDREKKDSAFFSSLTVTVRIHPVSILMIHIDGFRWFSSCLIAGWQMDGETKGNRQPLDDFQFHFFIKIFLFSYVYAYPLSCID